MSTDSTKNPIRVAHARLAIAARWHGKDSREAREAARELLAARIAKVQAEADRLKAELDEMGVPA